MLRKHGEEIINNKSIKVAGSGQWKNFQVVCCDSGEVLIEKKFRKTAFDEVMNNPDYKPFLDQLVEKAMVKVMTTTEGIDIDTESLSELEALQAEMFDGE